MKKIGLITFYSGNYGSILQCYSSKRFIESLGYDCNIIDIDQSEKKFERKIISGFRFVYRSLRYKDYFNNRKIMKNASKQEIKILSERSLALLNQFVCNNFQPKKYNWDELCNLGKSKEYIAFLVGSDQVWNASRDIDQFWFLKFAEKEKRIALAPSFAVKDVPNYNIKLLKKGIDGFLSLSVREESGKDIIMKLSGRESIRLPDPTILLSKKEWEEFGNKGIGIDEKYVFIHFLNKPNKIAIDTINEYIKNYSYRVICFAYNHDEYGKLVHYDFLDGSPYDYISLIKNANMVFTDSFHSTLFAINLETQFLTFNRQHLHNFSQKSRIVDLLERYKLSDRWVIKFISNNDINSFTRWDSDEVFSKERYLVKNYIFDEISKRDSGE